MAVRAGRFFPFPALFLAPYIVVTLVFFLYPFLSAFVLAFQQTNGPSYSTFVGFSNFEFIFSDPRFYRALTNTLIYAACMVGLQVPLSLGLAMLLNAKNSRTKGFFRLLIFSPHLVGQIFVGVLFSVLFIPRYGLVNVFLFKLFNSPDLLYLEWLLNENYVMPAIVLVSLWMYVGFNMIYFLAALQNVEEVLVEAAQIDGAGPWAIFRHVTLPAIRHVTTFVVIINTIAAFQLFELPYALLNSSFGPNDSGLTLVGYLYSWAFDQGDLGTGAAIGWALAFIMLIVSVIQIRISGTAREAD